MDDTTKAQYYYLQATVLLLLIHRGRLSLPLRLQTYQKVLAQLRQAMYYELGLE